MGLIHLKQLGQRVLPAFTVVFTVRPEAFRACSLHGGNSGRWETVCQAEGEIIFPIANRDVVTIGRSPSDILNMTRRGLRSDLLLAENIRCLLAARREDARSLAIWCGHKGAWISKVLSGERGVQMKDLGRIADFFGLTVAQLFQDGISTERRRTARRQDNDRRSGQDRRVAGERIYPGVQPTFQRGRDEDKERTG